MNDVKYVTTVNELAFLSAAEQFLLYTRFLMQFSGQVCVKQQKKPISISLSPILPAGLIHHRINVNPANLNVDVICFLISPTLSLNHKCLLLASPMFGQSVRAS